MELVDVNWLAVIAGAVSTMVVGFVWYSNMLFAKRWLKLSGLSEADVKNGPGVGYALTFVGSLFMSYVLAHFISYLGATDWMSGLQVGLWVGLGFVATAFLSEFIFNKRPRDLYFITAGYQVVALAIAGAVISGLS
jgi:hypothetical protein